MDKKPEKLVPEVRFKGFTDDWEHRKLGENTMLITKGTTPYNKSNKGPINFIKVENIKNNTISPSMHITEIENDSHLSRSKLKENDILFSIAGTLGRTAIVTSNILPANTNQALAIIRGYNFNQQFLINYLSGRAVKNFIRQNPTIGAQPNLSLKQIKSFTITVPNNDYEQIKIGSLIKKLNNLVTLQQRKLEQLRQLKIFTLQRMFIDKDCKQPILRFKNFNDNWLPHKFNDIANTFSGGTPAISNKDYYGGNIPFIRSAEINKNTTQLHLTPDGLKNSSAKFIKKGTLLYALYGATSGEVGIAQIDGAINQAVMAINLKKDNVYFIKTWLIKNKRKIISTYLQGGQGNLSAKIVKHLKLSLPKIEEEKLISITIMKIDSLIKLQQSKIDDLVNLKKYLLQKLFI